MKSECRLFGENSRETVLFQRFVTSIVTVVSKLKLNRTDTLDNNEEGSEADNQNCWKRRSKILPVD